MKDIDKQLLEALKLILFYAEARLEQIEDAADPEELTLAYNALERITNFIDLHEG